MEIVPELLRSAEFAEFQKRADPQRNPLPLVAHRVTKGRGLPNPSPLIAQGLLRTTGSGRLQGSGRRMRKFIIDTPRTWTVFCSMTVKPWRSKMGRAVRLA
jgi:hypothetical protein